MSPTEKTLREVAIGRAQNTLEAVAENLDRLAARIRVLSKRLDSDTTSLPIQASDIVSDYSSRTGNIGSRLGDVVHALALAHRAELTS